MIKSEIQNIKLRFGIIGNAEGLNRAIDIAMQVAPTDLSVLVTGESGVGKESFPQIIHQFSRRKHGPYIAVNCGAIPEGTIDSELFGHEKGAFTGAISDHNGYFAEANGGTIFLDEVGELPLSTQARLLRVLESGEYIKVGSSKVQKTDVRIVAATNINFTDAIAEGRFREDLYYRDTVSAGKDFKARIDIVEIEETLAVVRVLEEKWGGRIDFTDYLLLMKMGGEWKCVAKAYNQNSTTINK